jgi:hypothetical protein
MIQIDLVTHYKEKHGHFRDQTPFDLTIYVALMAGFCSEKTINEKGNLNE